MEMPVLDSSFLCLGTSVGSTSSFGGFCPAAESAKTTTSMDADKSPTRAVMVALPFVSAIVWHRANHTTFGSSRLILMFVSVQLRLLSNVTPAPANTMATNIMMPVAVPVFANPEELLGVL